MGLTAFWPVACERAQRRAKGSLGKTSSKRNARFLARRAHSGFIMSRNQLDKATSPYLLLHKDNPVNWYPWGPEALAEAERSGKPILLSIGFPACHWCHVINSGSFA